MKFPDSLLRFFDSCDVDGGITAIVRSHLFVRNGEYTATAGGTDYNVPATKRFEEIAQVAMLSAGMKLSSQVSIQHNV